MKKIMSLFAFVLAIGFCSCESDLDSKECTYTNPCPDLVEFGTYYCSGNSATGEVSLGFGVTSLSSSISQIYFGTITAYGGGETYTNGVIGYIGKQNTPEGVKVTVHYNEQFKTLTGVPTSLERFDQVTVEFDLLDGQPVRHLIFENMPITWN